MAFLQVTNTKVTKVLSIILLQPCCQLSRARDNVEDVAELEPCQYRTI